MQSGRWLPLGIGPSVDINTNSIRLDCTYAPVEGRWKDGLFDCCSQIQPTCMYVMLGSVGMHALISILLPLFFLPLSPNIHNPQYKHRPHGKYLSMYKS